MEQKADSKSRIFPTTSSFIIFCSYISLFVSQGLLVKSVNESQIKGSNSIVIVLLTELVKLILCIAIYLIRSKGNVSSLFKELVSNRSLLLYYLIPALLYCVYNNLTFINLKLFDLATYYCLMQFRIVLTAVIYQILFYRQLNRTQWASLIILTIGCLVKEYGMYKDTKYHIKRHFNATISNQTLSATGVEPLDKNGIETHGLTDHKLIFIGSTLLILLQMFCSCFAGVYNEYLLKDMATASNADVIMQNMFMYIDSIICNLVAYKIAPNSGSMNDNEKNLQLSAIDILYNLITNFLVVALILNNALSGLVASFFLKSLNSILKTFASALELFAITFFAWMLFGNSVDFATITALLLVSAAIIVYSRNPVSTAPPEKNRHGFQLIPTSENDEVLAK